MRLTVLQRKVHRLGGTQRYAYDILRGLVAAGDQVQLIHQSPVDPLPGVALRRLSTPLHGLPALLHFLATSQPVVRRLQTGSAESSPNALPEAPPLVLSLDRTLAHDVLRLGGGCHAAWLEASEGWQNGHPPWRRPLQLRNRVLLSLERHQMAATDHTHMITVSRHMRSELLRFYPHLSPERVHVLPNGVDLTRFRAALAPTHRESLRQALQLDPNRFVLLYVGTGAHRKGLDRVLLAFRRLLELAPDAPPPYLLLVGGDVEVALKKARLEGILRPPHHQHLGWMPRVDDIQKFYAAADLLLLPARYEPFGNVCLEAMAMGTPALTTTCNGVAELYPEDSQHLLQDSSLPDPLLIEGLVEKLRWLRSPLHRAPHIRLAIQTAEAHGLDAHIAALRGLLQHIAGEDIAGEHIAGEGQAGPSRPQP